MISFTINEIYYILDMYLKQLEDCQIREMKSKNNTHCTHTLAASVDFLPPDERPNAVVKKSL